MAKLVLLLVFVCFQFSRSEELSATAQLGLDFNFDDEAPFNNMTAPDFVNEDDVPFNDQTGPEQEMLDDDDEAPFNDMTAPEEVLDGADEDQWYQGDDLDDEFEAPFNNMTAPDFVNEGDVPLNDQTAPEEVMLDDDGEELIKISDSEYEKLLEDIERQFKAWFGKYFESQKTKAGKEGASWDYDEYLDSSESENSDYISDYKGVVFSKDGNKYEYSSTNTLTRVKNQEDENLEDMTALGDKILGYEKKQPVKRFTSV